MVFFSIVGALPLYGVVTDILFGIYYVNWYPGYGLAIASFCVGIALMRYPPSKRFCIESYSDNTGVIEVRELIWRYPMRYNYDLNSKIKLGLSKKDDVDIVKISLIDSANCHFTLDYRPLSRGLGESRIIAMRLAKAGNISLLDCTEGQNFEYTSEDMALPLYKRLQRYMHIKKREQPVELSCPSSINVVNMNSGVDRRYIWGWRAEGTLRIWLSCIFIIAMAMSLPIFKCGYDENLSLIDRVCLSGNIYGTVFFCLFLAIVILGKRTQITAEGYRLNIDRTLYGISIYHRSILLDKLFDMSIVNNLNSSKLVFIEENGCFSLPMASQNLAKYLIQDISKYIMSR